MREVKDATREQQLLALARGGNTRALDDLLRSQYDRIFAVCRRITCSEADGADAAQEAMMSIVRHLDRYDGTAAFSTWVYRIATNAALDELRRRSRRPVPVDELHDVATVTHGDTASRVAQRLEVDAALARLPTDYRVAVTLRDLCDLDYAEIASVLNIPLGTVRSRIARARAALGPLLSPGGNFPDEVQRPISDEHRQTSS